MNARHTRRLCIGSASIALGALLTPLAPAGAASSSALLNGTVALNGAPVAGATVTTSVWPNQVTLMASSAKVRATKKFQPVQMISLAATKTDASGHFRVQGNLAALPPSYRGYHGLVDVQVQAVSGSRQSTWTTSLRPTSRTLHAPAGYLSTSPRPSEQADQVRLELGTNRALSKAAAGYSSARPPALMKTDTPICITQDEGRVGPTKATWATIYASPNTVGRFNYTSSTQHRLAVGVSYNGGGYGTYSISGSSTKTAELGYDSGLYAKDAGVQTDWWYEQYYNSCGQWTQSPIYVHSLPYYFYTPHRRQPFCGPYLYGDLISRTQGSNYDYTVGVNVGGAMGESQAGWTTSTGLQYRIGTPGGGGGKLCWNGQYGSSTNGGQYLATIWSGEG